MLNKQNWSPGLGKVDYKSVYIFDKKWETVEFYKCFRPSDSKISPSLMRWVGILRSHFGSSFGGKDGGITFLKIPRWEEVFREMNIIKRFIIEITIQVLYYI